MTATREIWILGANGRCGRAVASELAARQHALVLVGRDEARLRDAAHGIGGNTRVVVADSIDDIAERISRSDAAVVVNTIGPFARTAVPIARACPHGCHYVDISNELDAAVDLLALHDEAVGTGRCFVTGAGFGFVATESVVLKVCEGQPSAASVRVDALPFVDGGGLLGDTLAATIVEGLPKGGRRYRNGALVRAQLGADPERLVLPDGSTMVTAAMPTGDLEAARRASGASSAVAASPMAPSTPLARFAMSAVAPLFASRIVRDFARRRLAQVHVTAPAQKRDSWGHARVQWPDGRVAEGWLRAGEAMAFTNAVMTAVTLRLAANEVRPGAYTPGALFGADLAVQAGARFIVRPSA
jgi:short subunit dehydrogenase-like uncharacterized protein